MYGLTDTNKDRRKQMKKRIKELANTLTMEAWDKRLIGEWLQELYDEAWEESHNSTMRMIQKNDNCACH
jgi:Txe/YoeB family toxin of Txe-Axe toxin-antitoxin module